MKTNELKKVLTCVRPGIAKKEIVEQTTHFIFTGEEVITYNDQICVQHPLTTEFKGSVRAEDLYRIINGVGDEEVELTQGKNKLRVKSKSTKAELAMFDNDGEESIIEKIKSLGLLEEKEWLQLSEDFINGVFLTMFSASKDQTQGIKTCVFVDGEGLWAGEENRISHYVMKRRMQSFLLPSSSASELIKFPVKQYSVGDSWIHFKTDSNVIFSATKMAGEDKYPDLAEYFDVEGEKLTLPKELKTIIDSISCITEAEIEFEKVVEIEIKNKKIRCKAEKERAKIEKFIDIEQGFNALFYINPTFLSQVLEKTTVATVGEQVIRFESEGFEHVIAYRATSNEEE